MDSLTSIAFADVMGHPAWMWLGFLAVVGALLGLDLGLLERRRHKLGIGESLGLSAFYVATGLAFGGWVWWDLGAQPGLEYLTGYLLEKSLSLDNIFVIATIFGYFAVPAKYQHRVLVWGILGVLVLRGVMIGMGAALVHNFEWVLYVFGAFLVVTGARMLMSKGGGEKKVEDNPVVRLVKARFRVTEDYERDHFVVRRPRPETGEKVLWLTPLALALITVESADVIFAIDSVPAVFSVTKDPFLVYTSNIFAILGLRALYFALAAMIERFKYLKQALALVLIFIGGKVLAKPVLGELPPALAAGVTLALLVGGVLYSLWRSRGGEGGRAAKEASSAA